MLFLTACAGVGSDIPTGTCTPVVEYSRAEQARVADEVAALPEGAPIVGWLADYSVMREQARACAGGQVETTVLKRGAATGLPLFSGDEQGRRKAHCGETGEDHGHALRAQHAT